jgi:hypothetical protein
VTVPADPPTKRELTVNKVIAGAGAAATSAVLGSFFGAAGTVGGAALGSVFSTVVTSLYQHSLDRTRDTVKARVKLPGGRTVDVAGTTEVPAPHVAPGGETGQARVYVTPGDRPTEVLSAVPATGEVAGDPPKSRRRLLVMAGFTVVVFALGLLAVTGIELLKGSPLNTSGTTDSGTSVGRVLTGGSGTGASDTSSDTSTSATSATETDDPDSAPTTAARSSAERTAERGSGAGSDDEPAPATPRNSAQPTPTPTPQSGGGGAAESAGPVAAG